MIVAHHYVVNSGLMDIVEAQKSLGTQDIFLLIFGSEGKTGINCFVLITGYFMCKSNITAKKYGKLLGQRYFYTIVIWIVFLMTGYELFSLKVFEGCFSFLYSSREFYGMFFIILLVYSVY